MIFTSLGPDAVFYRALTPRWAYLPESGAGAALVGGRFNRTGIEARYLAQSVDVAVREYQSESPLLPPCVLAAYTVTAERIVDFSGGFDADRWTPIWREAHCNWKQLWMRDRVEPPSWTIGDLVREAGAAGLLYRSVTNPPGICLVLYPDMPGFRAPVFDPAEQLPRNPSSWG